MTNRRAIESALRVAALALLAWGAWDVWRPAPPRPARVASVRDLARALDAWTRDSSLAALHVVVDTAPAARDVAELRALAGAGARVTWSGDVPALAIAAAPLADPRGGVAVGIAAPAGTRLALRDASGAIDTLRASGGGASVELPFATGRLGADAGPFAASALPGEPPALRSLLVLGTAGWEAKFVVAALEERGWRVVARLAVGPGAVVGQGELGAIDTARYSAVVALDSGAAPYAAAIARAVREGVGLVLAGDAARTGALASLAPARAGARVGARTLLASDSIGPATLAFRPLGPLPGAVALARRDAGVIVAARRVGSGRVVQTSLEESWRWRMEGGEGSVDAHRDWWGRLVAGVAYAPARAIARPLADTAAAAAAVDAPRLRLADALGGPSAAPRERGGVPASRALWPFALAALCLALEWASRRLRGAR